MGQAHTPLSATDVGVPQRARRILMAVPPIVALCVALWHGPYLIDDAYITFRYAENLAAGRGMVFNPHEPVLGTTTPLFAVLLGAVRWLGLEIPSAARVIGLASAMGIVLITQRLAARFVGPVAALAAGLCLALHPELAFTANSGMETGLSMVAVYATLLLALEGRYLGAGLAGGLAFLLRPDGALAAILAIGLAGWRAPRRIWKPLLAALLIASPWLIYALLTYGSAVPQSIQAKQLLHPDSPFHILQVNLARLTFGFGMKALCGLALVGLAAAGARRCGLLLVGVWLLTYLAGLSATRIVSLFPWYITPLLPALVLLAVYGVSEIGGALAGTFARSAGKRKPAAEWAAALSLLVLGGVFLSGRATWRTQIYDPLFGQRVQAYLRIADLLRSRCAAGDVVLVGEVGALAYALPEQVIVDTSGINSREVFLARQADQQRRGNPGRRGPAVEDSPALVIELVDRFKPRYIVTYWPWLHIREIMQVPRIRSTYRFVRLDMPSAKEYVVLERRERSETRP